MFHSHAKFCLLVLLVVVGNNGFAQTSTSSNPTNGRENNPYSKYGIGELSNSNSTVLKGMGNATSAFENPYEMNTDNPASYSFLGQTTFELGATASTRNITNGAGLTYGTGTATLSYFTLGFPVNKHSGFTLGFKPVSHVYYAMVDTLFSPISPIGQVIRSYNGEGGLNYAFMGGGWRHKGLSIGCNLGYMFGNIHNTTATVPIDPNVIYRANVAQYTTYNQLGGLAWKAGLMYEKKLDSNYTLRIGGTLALSQSLTQRMNAFQISSYNFSDTIVNDTLSNSGELHGKLKLPMSFSVGVMLSKNDNWSVGLDFASSQWSGYNSSLDSTMNSGIRTIVHW